MFNSYVQQLWHVKLVLQDSQDKQWTITYKYLRVCFKCKFYLVVELSPYYHLLTAHETDHFLNQAWEIKCNVNWCVWAAVHYVLINNIVIVSGFLSLLYLNVFLCILSTLKAITACMPFCTFLFNCLWRLWIIKTLDLICSSNYLTFM